MVFKSLMKERIKALREVKLFKSLNSREIKEAAETLEVVSYKEGDYVLRQHEQGSDFFMVDTGECVMEVDGEVVSKYIDRGSFGKRALINDEPRAASIKVTSETLVCFRMSQEVFKKILTDRIKVLQQVKLLQSLGHRELAEAAEALELVSFKKGDYLVRQGEMGGTKFLIVNIGECAVEIDGAVVWTFLCAVEADGTILCKSSDKNTFGERFLLREGSQTLSARVTSDTFSCFRISPGDFKMIISDLIKERTKALREVKLFKSLNSGEIEWVATTLEIVSFRKGDYVMKQGEQGSEHFMVDTGECAMIVDGEVVSKYIDRGSFGEHALKNDEPRVASIKVTSETLVCFRLSQELFKGIMEDRIKILQRVKLLQSFGHRELVEAAEALELVSFKKGDYLARQGEKGTEFFIFNSGVCAVEVDGAVIGKYGDEDTFGERFLLRKEPHLVSIRVTSDTLSCFRICQGDFKVIISDRNRKESLVKNCTMFETMSDDQVAILVSAFHRVRYPVYPGAPPIIRQDAPTDADSCFFLLEEGECVATILQPDGSQQEVKSYRPGDIFGEKALMESKPRAASIAPTVDIVVLQLSRAEFEKQLGSPMSQLEAEQYNSDPRKLLADFYRKGDLNGPIGSLPSVATKSGNQGVRAMCTDDADNAEVSLGGSSSWFVVVRPCSRDSIAKMIGKVGVGKGLNIKGKSAKKNRLSGFVPFVQISDNAHKEMVEAPSTSPAYNIYTYFRSAANRDEAKIALETCLDQMVLPEGEVASPSPIELLTRYEKSSCEPSFGLSVPEFLFMEFYIVNPDLSPVLGWETGRPSRPAFLNDNLHSVRMKKDGTPPSDPPACLYQFDKDDPLNPSGLLVAYAEELHVKPVVSDFDTFLVGSQGAKPFDNLVDDQRAKIMWLLNKTENVLLDKEGGIRDKKFNWTSAWLEKVMSEEAMKKDTLKVHKPKLGFGDPTSYQLTKDVVDKLAECGAVRHQAECFNYGFPQELDEEFLVVWDGYESLTGKPWETLNEKELIEFLFDRAQENFVFPLNPVWMVRDGKNGWSKLFELMLSNSHIKKHIKCWYDEETIAKIRELSKKVLEFSEELVP